MSRGRQASSTAGAEAALSATSGPTPKGSPVVTAMTGFMRGWSCGEKFADRERSDPVGTRRPALVLLLGLVHVLDAVLHDHQVRSPVPVDLDAGPVVPLDDAVQLLSVLEDDDHRRPGVHLLQIVEGLGVR